jgi:hypothetical protein
METHVVGTDSSTRNEIDPDFAPLATGSRTSWVPWSTVKPAGPPITGSRSRGHSQRGGELGSCANRSVSLRSSVVSQLHPECTAGRMVSSMEMRHCDPVSRRRCTSTQRGSLKRVDSTVRSSLVQLAGLLAGTPSRRSEPREYNMERRAGIGSRRCIIS